MVRFPQSHDTFDIVGEHFYVVDSTPLAQLAAVNAGFLART